MAWSIFRDGGGQAAAVNWAASLLTALGAPITSGNIQFIYDWEVSEGGGGAYNPLNQGPVPGQPALTTTGSQYGGGAADFASFQAGIEGAVAYLNMPNFVGVRDALMQDNPSGAKAALIASPWAASHYGGGANFASSPIPAGITPQATAGITSQATGGITGPVGPSGMPQIQLPTPTSNTTAGQISQSLTDTSGQVLADQPVGGVDLSSQSISPISDISVADQNLGIAQPTNPQSFNDPLGLGITLPSGLSQGVFGAPGPPGGTPTAGMPGTLQSSLTGTTAFINAAYSQIGVPYGWGAESPGAAFDCSALVQWALKSSTGFDPGRDTGAQFSNPNMIQIPSLQAAQPGDLVFFGWDGSRPDHVAIYLGNGKILDADHSGDTIGVRNSIAGYGSITGIRRAPV